MSDVFHFVRSQVAGEIKKYSPDFSDVIPTGGSIASGSASTLYTQTFNGTAAGSAATTINAAGTIATFTTPALSTGVYQFVVSCTLTDGQLRKALYSIMVVP